MSPWCALALSLPLMAQTPITVNGQGVSMKVGMLAQPMYEMVGSPDPQVEGNGQNLFLRRFRLVFGGAVGQNLEFFFETDNSDLGKKADGAIKSSTPIQLQDAHLTWKFNDRLKLDAGLILVPGTHQANQGATTLAGLDYSPYAFAATNAFGNRAGRDTGLQLRGLLGKLEFRTGVFQGRRVDATPTRMPSRNALRVAARAQYNLFDVENGTFLAGTYLGAKKILSFGVAHDQQEDYRSTSVDAFLDWPVGTDTLTAQVDHVRWDGGDWLTKGLGAGFSPLFKQKTTFAEVAYRFGSSQLAPSARWEARTMDTPTKAVPDERRMGVGLAWWLKGHTSNLKLHVQEVRPEAPPAKLRAYRQVNLQWQVYFF